MENKKTVVYKRRPRKPLSDLPANGADIHGDKISRSSSASVPDKHGTRPIIVENTSRKSWIDRSLSAKGRRSSVSCWEEFNLTGMAYKWVGTLFRSVRSQVPDVEENLRNRQTKNQVNRNKTLKPPVEFVKEKQAMFAEIDSFELESEEESPASKCRPQEWTKEHIDVSQDVVGRRRGLDIVHEDELEEFASCLSAALLTPHWVSQPHDSREESSQSSSLKSGSPESSLRALPSKPRTVTSDFEVYSSPITSFVIDESATNNNISDAGMFTARSDLSVCFEASLRSPRFTENRSSLDDYNHLVSGIRSLHIGEYGCQVLSPLVDEDEDELPKNIDNESSTGTELSPQCRRITQETSAIEPLPIFKALLEQCHQTQPLSLQDAISDFCDLSEMVKLGEGTFGEAFKGGGCVFKIVPMDGDFLVNAELQKTSAEIYSEVLLTNTLNRLRGLDLEDSMMCRNYCTNFIETKIIRICQGSYEAELCLAWEKWDAVRGSDNDHPMLFPQHQLYVVFVLADGGKDLESFVLSDFNEAQSLLLQVVLALAVAEDGCRFEHRDLHWGNIVLARDQEYTCGFYRLGGEVFKMKTFGLSVSIIDFTLSRIDTGKHVFYFNLSTDPALFEGPSRDIQADTYRRMLNVTKGNWEASFPQTNCHWIHYISNVLVKEKSYKCSAQQKRALRSFCKRVLLYESAKAAVCDDFFHDMWIKDLNDQV